AANSASINSSPHANSASTNSSPNANSASTNSINDISSNQNNTNNEISILNSKALWEFKPLENSIAQGDITVENNTKSLTLSGSGFLKENVGSTKNLSKLTLSVWVKPDYSQGSPEF